MLHNIVLKVISDQLISYFIVVGQSFLLHFFANFCWEMPQTCGLVSTRLLTSTIFPVSFAGSFVVTVICVHRRRRLSCWRTAHCIREVFSRSIQRILLPVLSSLHHPWIIFCLERIFLINKTCMCNKPAACCAETDPIGSIQVLRSIEIDKIWKKGWCRTQKEKKIDIRHFF